MRLFYKYTVALVVFTIVMSSSAIAGITVNDNSLSDWMDDNLSQTTIQDRTSATKVDEDGFELVTGPSGPHGQHYQYRRRVYTDDNYNNPSYDTLGNVHIEEGYSNGDYYDAEMLGLLIDDSTLNIALQSNFDFTDSNPYNSVKNGDFIFNFSNGDTDTQVALSFDFGSDDQLTSLTFYWGNINFETATDVLNDYTATYANSADHELTISSSNEALWAQIVDSWLDVSQDDGDDGENYYYGDLFSFELAFDYSLLASLTDIADAASLLSIFTDNSIAMMYWQMGCGNDILYVADEYSNSSSGSDQGSDAVPEPATFFLLGIGLLGAAFLERRREKLQKKS